MISHFLDIERWTLDICFDFDHSETSPTIDRYIMNVVPLLYSSPQDAIKSTTASEYAIAITISLKLFSTDHSTFQMVFFHFLKAFQKVSGPLRYIFPSFKSQSAKLTLQFAASFLFSFGSFPLISAGWN